MPWLLATRRTAPVGFLPCCGERRKPSSFLGRGIICFANTRITGGKDMERTGAAIDKQKNTFASLGYLSREFDPNDLARHNRGTGCRRGNPSTIREFHVNDASRLIAVL